MSNGERSEDFNELRKKFEELSRQPNESQPKPEPHTFKKSERVAQSEKSLQTVTKSTVPSPSKEELSSQLKKRRQIEERRKKVERINKDFGDISKLFQEKGPAIEDWKRKWGISSVTVTPERKLKRQQEALKVKSEKRQESNKKDMAIASKYLESAKKVDSIQALAERNKLLAAKKGQGTSNVLGLLQEARLDDPLTRRDQFWDRLSQSGATLVEHGSTSGKKGGPTGSTREVKLKSKTEASEDSKKFLDSLVKTSGGDNPAWQDFRRNEIKPVVEMQAKKVSQLEESLKKAKEVPKESDEKKAEVDRLQLELDQASSDLKALQNDADLIDKTLKSWPKAFDDFMKKYNGRWGDVKKAAKKGDEEARAAMKAARWVRQEFMNDALEKTAMRCLNDYVTKMKIKSYKIEELTPSDSPKADSKYMDGRSRRYRLTLPDEEQIKIYGPTLTLFFFAPGSTEDTSDIDMQFIVEENPTGCTELIQAFQEVAAERLQLLSEASGGSKGNLAAMFDVNPYPAGFVARTELGSDLHFSDTYTQRSTDAKKEVDSGLALIRRLETPPTDEKGVATDPIASILSGSESDPELRDKKLRSLRSGTDVLLKSQFDRAQGIIGLIDKKKLEVDAKLKEELLKLIEIGKELNKQSSWDPLDSWGDVTLDEKALKGRLDCAHKLEAAIHHLSEAMDEKSFGSGKELVAQARNEAYLDSQRKVEELTRARDLAMIEGTEKISKLETEMKNAQNKGNMELYQKLKEEHAKALEELRSATSALGVAAFMAQGVALNNADEAYTNRGAIGHVVEEQMGRAFLKTTGSAISSLEANAGFILEHFEHDAPETLNDLYDFANATGKYLERIGKAYETIDYWAVHSKKNKSPGDHVWIVQLGDALSMLKKSRHPVHKGFLSSEEKKAENLFKLTMACLNAAGIKSVSDLKKKLEEITRDAWDAYYSS